MKICIKCEIEKPTNEFRPQNNACKKCLNNYSSIWRRANPEKVIENMRSWRKANPGRTAELGRRWRKDNPEKAREQGRKDGAIFRKRWPGGAYARQLVSNDRAKGTLTPLPCNNCNNPYAEAHHPDYSKPLDVIWLCKPCHWKEHQRLRRVV